LRLVTLHQKNTQPLMTALWMKSSLLLRPVRPVKS